MLAHILAIAIGLSSLVLFLTAFSMSEIHRKDDFLWSSIGLFYALVLWFCASRITGSLLLGQIAAVTLVLSFNWQTLKLRKAIANPSEAANTDFFSLTGLIGGLFQGSDSSASQPNIAQVLEEENAVEEVTPPITNLENSPTTEVTLSKEVSTTIPETTEIENIETQSVTDVAFTEETVKETETDTSVSENTETPTLEAELATSIDEIEDSTLVGEESRDTDIAFTDQTDTSVSENVETPTLEVELATSTDESEDSTLVGEESRDTDIAFTDQTDTSVSKNVETPTLEAELATSTDEIEDSTLVGEESRDTDIAFTDQTVNETETATSVSENPETQPNTEIGYWEEESLTVESEDLENLIGSNTSYNPTTEVDDTTESIIIIPAVEDDQELAEIESNDSIELDRVESLEEIILSQETTETEGQDRTASESNPIPPVENVDLEKPTDVDFTRSKNEDKSQSSLDDFLAELENSIDKKPNEDN